MASSASESESGPEGRRKKPKKQEEESASKKRRVIMYKGVKIESEDERDSSASHDSAEEDFN